MEINFWGTVKRGGVNVSESCSKTTVSNWFSHPFGKFSFSFSKGLRPYHGGSPITENSRHFRGTSSTRSCQFGIAECENSGKTGGHSWWCCGVMGAEGWYSSRVSKSRLPTYSAEKHSPRKFTCILWINNKIWVIIIPRNDVIEIN